MSARKILDQTTNFKSPNRGRKQSAGARCISGRDSKLCKQLNTEFDSKIKNDDYQESLDF